MAEFQRTEESMDIQVLVEGAINAGMPSDEAIECAEYNDTAALEKFIDENSVECEGCGIRLPKFEMQRMIDGPELDDWCWVCIDCAYLNS